MKFSKKVLKNGLRVIAVPMEDNPTVTISVLVNVGSEYENAKIAGISHFLEHMAFKGTVKRPTSTILANEMDGLGAKHNAFTSREMTGYWTKGDVRHFEKLFDIIADIYLNSTMPSAEIEKEKGVILGEIEMYNDLPQSVASDNFFSLVYGVGPHGAPILGKKETVKSFNRSQFLNYRKTHYLPGKTVVVVSGGIKPKEVFKKAAEYFGAVSAGRIIKKEKWQGRQKKPAYHYVFKKTDQTHLVLGTHSYDLFNKRNIPAEVLATLLGRGMSSRLSLKLREEMGAGYYVLADQYALTDRGIFEISAGVHTNMINEVIAAILDEMRRVIKEPISAKELKKTKDFMIGHLHLDLETSDELANFYGLQEVLGKPIEKPEEIERRINAVSANDLRNMAKMLFRNENLNLVLVGPKAIPNIKHMLKF